jgi:hypothetical protein
MRKKIINFKILWVFWEVLLDLLEGGEGRENCGNWSEFYWSF